jgi:uncharacterized membrane protein YjgN (DUF898 family)
MASGLEAVPIVEDVAPEVEALRFEFTGSGAEYFRIWIVNLALTVATFGIYSAWAKVRTVSYFYGNTRLAGASFAYLAKPEQILKGRAIAFAVFVAYSVVTELSPVLAVILSLAALVVTPWLIVRALAFRARHSAFRNIRFAFEGESGEAAQAYILYPLLTGLSLGLFYPLSRLRQASFVINGARFGTTALRHHATAGAYYKACMRLFLYAVPALIVVVLEPRLAVLALPALAYGTVEVSTALTNLWYNETTLGEHRFRCSLRAPMMAWLYLGNTLGVIASSGLLLPWARVRLARYRASCLEVHALGGLDGFVAGEATQVSALGEEVADLFDVDIGF